MSAASYPIATVEQISGLEDGSIAIGPFGSAMKADLYTPTGIPVVRGNNIGPGRELVGDYVYVGEETAARLKRSLLQEGDLFFPHRGAIGEVGLITATDPQPVLMSTSLMRLRVNPELADPEFVFWFFKSAAGKHEILLYASTVGTPGIGQPLTSLRAMTLPLPPLPEQREIAAILGALDDKIELNRKTAATLEAMARALYRSWFVDFDPVWAKTEGRPPAHMDEATAALFPDSFGDDGLPVGWFRERLEKYFISRTEKDNGRNIEEFSSSNDGIFPRSKKYKKKLSADGSKNKVAHRGDFVFGLSRKVMNYGMMEWDIGAFSSAYRIYSVPEGYHRSQFIFSQMKENAEYFYQAVSASSREGQSISERNLFNLEVLAPPHATLDAYYEQSGRLLTRKSTLDEQNQTLATLRDTLLPRLMSGELRVGEAREQVENVA